MKNLHRLLLLAITLLPGLALAQFSDYNFPQRRAVLVNVCPQLKLTTFTFGNTSQQSTDRFSEEYGWENVGSKEIEAFELVTLKYDPFNEPLLGARAIYPGHNSASYKPLKPTEKDADGSYSLGSEDTYTAIVYVYSVRFTDGTIWKANPADVLATMKQQVPDITDPGKLAPVREKNKGGDS